MAQPQTEAQILAKRLISALVMIPPVLGAIIYGFPAFDLLIGLVFIVLAYEWIGLCDALIRRWDKVFFYVFGITALVLVSLVDVSLGMWTVLGGSVFLTVAHILFRKTSRPTTSSPVKTLSQLPWLAFGYCYFVFALVILILLRQEGIAGRNIILLLFLIAWAADTGAYAFGRLIGGPKLAPVMSPNKTWAGFIGGTFCAGAVAAGYAVISQNSAVFLIIMSAATLGIVSQGGDLLESCIKRRFQVKDTSTLIPGHGGLLDRLDSLLAMSWAIGVLYWLARKEVLQWM